MDPRVVDLLRGRAKKQIRERMRALRARIPAKSRLERSRVACERVAAELAWQRARSVALFCPAGAELDVSLLDERARADGKRVAYPFTEPVDVPPERVREALAEAARSGQPPDLPAPVTGFRFVESVGEFGERGQRFSEPPVDAPLAGPEDLDVIVVPALAVASDGARVGYGGGWYDRTLPRFAPPATTVVVGFGFQLLAEVPADEHDVRCALVLTDEHRFAPGTGP